MTKRYALIQKKIEALRAGKEPTINLREELDVERPGDTAGPDMRAVRRLARRYQQIEDPDYCSVSWANQVKAAQFFTAHGLARTLDEVVRLGGTLD